MIRCGAKSRGEHGRPAPKELAARARPRATPTQGGRLERADRGNLVPIPLWTKPDWLNSWLCGSPARGIMTAVSEWGRAWRMTSRSEEHTSELQSRENLVCRLLLEKKKRI